MTLFERIFNGNDAVYSLTEQAVDAAIAKYGEEKTVGFPDAAFYLPCYYAATGVMVKSLKEMKEALAVVKSLMTREKRLHDAFMSGIATALCAEFVEALKYTEGTSPYDLPCYGHLGDEVVCDAGGAVASGDISGIAVILGTAPTSKEAVSLVKAYQEQKVLVTLTGGVIDQLEEEHVETGADIGVIPLGKDTTAVVHAVSFALRAALMSGNVKPGDVAGVMKYTFEQISVFVNAFAPLDDVIVACGAGAIALGFPVITNETENIFRVPKSLIVQKEVSRFCATSLEARNIKMK